MCYKYFSFSIAKTINRCFVLYFGRVWFITLIYLRFNFSAYNIYLEIFGTCGLHKV